MTSRVALLLLLVSACGSDSSTTSGKDAASPDVAADSGVVDAVAPDDDPGSLPDVAEIEAPPDIGPQCGDEIWCADIVACIAPSLDCATAKECAGGWTVCESGQSVVCGADGAGHCCGESLPTWCHPVWSAAGFCAGQNADCAQSKSCDGKTLVACDKGALANCTADGALACCGGDNPLWCEPGSSKVPGFPGLCMPPASVCTTIGKDAQGGWAACQPGDDAGLSQGGHLVCCSGGEVYCPFGSGTAKDYPGDACQPKGTNCDSLTKLTAGGWASCPAGSDFGVVQTTGELVCCDGATPLFCGSGFVADGDLSEKNSKSLKAEVTTCSVACTADSDCPAWPKPGVVTKCKGPGGVACNQCVLDPANDINQSLTPGGCFAAPPIGGSKAEMCAYVHEHRIVCGETLQPCEGANWPCYCWKGVLYPGY